MRDRERYTLVSRLNKHMFGYGRNIGTVYILYDILLTGQFENSAVARR